MSFVDRVRAQLRPAARTQSMTLVDLAEPQRVPASAGMEHSTAPEKHEKGAIDIQNTLDHDDTDATEKQTMVEVRSGAVQIEAVQAVWGKYGKKLVIAGLVMIMINYELANSTTYTYQSYATSSFNDLSLLATINTASTILFAVAKPPIAKISDVIGRGETYILVIAIFSIAFILCASASSISVYAAGSILQAVGQSGTNLMNDIIISDISSARWRGFAIGISFFPFLITPWISAFIVESVVTGIGWRWGIGMFAIIIPFGACFIIVTLLYYQRKAKKMGIVATKKISIYEFCSLIDLGGTILLSGGFAMLLIPITLASTTTSKWRTPWLDALIALGALFLLALPVYEKYLAKHPVVPIQYFRNMTIVMGFLLIATDSLGFGCSHTYLYPWAVIAHNFSARDATFYTSTNGVTQCLAGIVAGLIMYRTRKYKWLTIAAVVIRLIGYGVMIRLRGADNSMAELFIVQLIQGVGSGIIQIVVIVAPQVVVPHSQLAQVTALAICCSFLGSSVGSAIAGGIYTGTFKDQLRAQLGEGASQELIDTVYSSITGTVPLWGSSERIAINQAYSNVLRFTTYAALASSIPSLVFAFFLPDLTLPDKHNVVEEY